MGPIFTKCPMGPIWALAAIPHRGAYLYAVSHIGYSMQALIRLTLRPKVLDPHEARVVVVFLGP